MTESNGELLIRIDERLASLNREVTENIKPQIDRIADYNIQQNGHISDLIKECASNTAWIKGFKWIMGGCGTAFLVWITNYYGIW